MMANIRLLALTASPDSCYIILHILFRFGWRISGRIEIFIQRY